MSVVADVIAQIKDMPSSPFRAVEGLAEFALLTRPPAGKTTPVVALRVSPTVYVLPLSDSSSRQDLAAVAFRQQTTIGFGCVIALRDVSDPKGASAVETIDGLKASLRDYLVAWTPASAQFPVEHVRGSLQGIVNGVSFWLDEFRCGLQIRKP